jgi:hypothetical protein
MVAGLGALVVVVVDAVVLVVAGVEVGVVDAGVVEVGVDPDPADVGVEVVVDDPVGPVVEAWREPFCDAPEPEAPEPDELALEVPPASSWLNRSWAAVRLSCASASEVWALEASSVANT